MARRNKNIIPYRKQPNVNIGIIIFAFVLIYFLVYLFNYVTEKHVTVFEVTSGSIAKNTYYTGMVIREENLTKSTKTGNINYYIKEGDKAGYGDLICSIDGNGNISKEITEAGLDASTLSKPELVKIQAMVADYNSGYSDMNFYNVYSFKDSVNSNIQEDLYLNALDQLSTETDSAVSKNTFSFVTAQQDGVLAFYTDGCEDITIDNFKAEDFNPGAYTKDNLKGKTSVSSGDPLYKTISQENWYIMIPLSTSEYAYYLDMADGSDSFVIHVTFNKDNSETYAVASIRKVDSKYFLQLSFNSSMVRFISDRYLELELGSNRASGLKIPNSAITQKEFLIVPKEYVGKGGNSGSSGLLKVNKQKGGTTVEFVPTSLYYETTDNYYVSEESLKIGDVIQKPDSDEQYTITSTGTLDGVYNLNKGYAVFKQIEPLSNNEEYTIVEKGTSYGLTLYDHIALDGNSVTEGEIIH